MRMNSFLYFLERHKTAILGTLFLHMAIFIYFQIETFSEDIFYTPENRVHASIEKEDVIELLPENIQTEQQAMQEIGGPVSSLTKNENDSRKTSSVNFSKSSIDKQVENEINNYANNMFKEYGKDNPTLDESVDEKKNVSKKTPLETQPHGDGKTTQIKGQTMVSYNMTNRYPYNNNDWYIRNPGYTCEDNTSGVVVVDVVINPSGNVVSAHYNASKSSGATSCMVGKAQQYAAMSRFAYKSDAPATQSGTIIYRFVSN